MCNRNMIKFHRSHLDGGMEHKVSTNKGATGSTGSSGHKGQTGNTGSLKVLTIRLIVVLQVHI